MAGGVGFLEYKDKPAANRHHYGSDDWAVLGLGIAGVVAGGLLVAILGVYLVWTGLAARTTSGHIARENSIRNPTRTSATALALTIGTALVSALLVLSQSLTGTFRGALDNSVKADYVVESAADIGFPEEVKAIVDEVPGVEATSGLRFASVRFGFPGSDPHDRRGRSRGV